MSAFFVLLAFCQDCCSCCRHLLLSICSSGNIQLGISTSTAVMPGCWKLPATLSVVGKSRKALAAIFPQPLYLFLLPKPQSHQLPFVDRIRRFVYTCFLSAYVTSHQATTIQNPESIEIACKSSLSRQATNPNIFITKTINLIS